MSKIDEKTKEIALSLYTPPFKYDLEGQMIFDSNDNLVTDIRGWGRIQKLKNAEVVMDTVGEQIAEAMTEHWMKASSSKNLNLFDGVECGECGIKMKPGHNC